jgi:ABC-type multidrug transport system fused ATPase/permease subunit
LWLALLIVIPLISSGEINGVMLGTFALMTFASFEAVNPLPLSAQMWNASREASARLFAVVDIEPAVKEHDGKTLKAESSHNLQFSNLSFSYPDTTTPALQHVTFDLQPGTSTAIVGPSGAGKSTIANLLFRFWEYESGEICLGGEEIGMLNPHEVRRRCALVAQKSYFFNTSIHENLRIARPSASQAEIEAAARAAQIHDFVMNLPKGYDTVIGEQGVRLSGGERQRLGIARALLKKAPILILDEPTANLDPVTEKQVLDTLFRIMRGKTTLLITHRLIGLERVAEILVMDKGRIIERGRHAELVAHAGLYARMLNAQNQVLSDSGGKVNNALN